MLSRLGWRRWLDRVFGIRKNRKSRKVYYRATLEPLEDRFLPANITVTGFADGAITPLSGTTPNFTADNLRSAIAGANSLNENSTILLSTGTYTLNAGAGFGELLINNTNANSLIIENNAGGISVIDAQNQGFRVFENDTPAEFDSLKIEDGQVFDGSGGGGILAHTDLTLNNSQVVNNEADGMTGGFTFGQGGGIFHDGGLLTITDSLIAGNVAKGATDVYGGAGQGGGIFNNDGDVIIRDSTIDSNMAVGAADTSDSYGGPGQGGGMFLGSSGGAAVTITGTTFSRNTATSPNEPNPSSNFMSGAEGGGLYQSVEFQNLDLLNSTFGGNTASGFNAEGGGLVFSAGGEGVPATLTNDTIAANQATGSGAVAGGGVFTVNTFINISPEFVNTIIARNQVNGSKDSGDIAANDMTDGDGGFNSQGHNLVGTTSNYTTNPFSNAGDLTGTDANLLNPVLGFLGNNGGPTQTFALLSGSPAINAGDNTAVENAGLTTDQRGPGFPRIVNGIVDIGAFEFAPPTSFGTGRDSFPRGQVSSSSSGSQPSIDPDPTGTIATDVPTFDWTAVVGADHYDLWVNDLTTGQSQVLRLPDLLGTSVALTSAQALTPGHSYLWWIGAVNSAGTVDWSDAQDLTIAPLAAPVILAPAGTSATDMPLLSWTSVNGADHYDLWMDDLTSGQSQALRLPNLSNTSITLTAAQALTPGHTYYWWIGAVSTNGHATSWSQGQYLTIAALSAPSTNGPTGSIDSDTPGFSWNSVPADHYELWIADTTTGQSPVVLLQGLTGTSVALSAGQYLTPGHNYVWWIGAVSTNGQAIAWSSGQGFTVNPLATPTGLAVLGPADSDIPSFTWNSVNGAGHYDLWIDDVTWQQSQVLRLSTLTTTSVALDATQALTPGHTYRWWIGAVSNNGLAEVWSAGQQFTITALSAPISGVLSGTISTALPTFTWSAVNDAADYDLWVDNLTTGQSQVIRERTLTTTSLALTAGQALITGDSYIWWIGAVSTNGEATVWSAGQVFTVAV